MLEFQKNFKKYEPYWRITFCSNVIEGGGYIFEMSGKHPVLIGKGNPPLVWLSIPAKDGVRSIVNGSRSLENSVSVVSILGGTQIVLSGGHIILSVRQISPNEAEVDEIDLRPFGLSVHGNRDGLKVGGMSLSGNHFSGVGTMFSFG